MKAKCKKCSDTVEVTRPREYKTCKCGAIGLDYGDGENYCRVCGDLEDFDGDELIILSHDNGYTYGTIGRRCTEQQQTEEEYGTGYEEIDEWRIW